MITLLSAFAQMESESISQNVRIGLNYKMQRGEWSVAYSNFLGYDRTPEGEIVINLEGAKTVRFIFDHFLSGHSLLSEKASTRQEAVCLRHALADCRAGK